MSPSITFEAKPAASSFLTVLNQAGQATALPTTDPEAGSHRYHLTEKGQRTITAVLVVCRTDTAKLMEQAA